MTVNTVVIDTYLAHNQDATEVPLEDGQFVQVLASFQDLPRARRHQYAAFVVEESALVVWDDEPLNICGRASGIVKNMTDMVWTGQKGGNKNEKELAVQVVEVDEESGAIVPQQRRIVLLNSIYVALTLVLIISVLGAGFREIAIEVAVDKNMIRLAFLALTPIQVFFTLVRRSLPFGPLSQPFSSPVTNEFTRSVLRASYHRLHFPNHRPHAANALQQQILQQQQVSTPVR